MSEIFNDLKPSHFNKLGHPHYPGQIYRPKKYKAKLYAEDNTCGICNKPIKRLEGATLDHIVPRVHGGHTTKDNIQLAHKMCNFKKGHEI